MVFTRAGGSLFAVALLHGSFNAGASTRLVGGGWEYVVALVVLTSVVSLGIRVREGRWS